LLTDHLQPPGAARGAGWQGRADGGAHPSPGHPACARTAARHTARTAAARAAVRRRRHLPAGGSPAGNGVGAGFGCDSAPGQPPSRCSRRTWDVGRLDRVAGTDRGRKEPHRSGSSAPQGWRRAVLRSERIVGREDGSSSYDSVTVSDPASTFAKRAVRRSARQRLVGAEPVVAPTSGRSVAPTSSASTGTSRRGAVPDPKAGAARVE
jgi:hypothetical protein